MPPSSDRLWVLAVAVKTAVIAGYVDADVDMPSKQCVVGGLPAWDCEDGLFAVQVENTFGYSGELQTQTIQSLAAHPGHAMRGAMFALHMIRCIPLIDTEGDQAVFPSADEEEDAAEVILTDAQLMINAIVAAEKEGDLPGCSGVAFEQWINVQPQGGLGGGILRVRLAL